MQEQQCAINTNAMLLLGNSANTGIELTKLVANQQAYGSVLYHCGQSSKHKDCVVNQQAQR